MKYIETWKHAIASEDLITRNYILDFHTFRALFSYESFLMITDSFM